MHSKSQRLLEIFTELGNLHLKKSADYGQEHDPFANITNSKQWGVRPWIGAMIRAQDKVERLHAFALKGKLMNESAQDSLRDLAVYSIIALIELEQEAMESDLQGT